MNILFIGNSYTYFHDMPALFENLARANGHDVTVSSVTCGGRKLYEYIDKRDEFAEKLDAVTASERFDICFLQEQSLLSVTDFSAFLDGVTRLTKKLKAGAGRFVLYETWGRKAGCETLLELGMTNESMTFAIADAYTNAAKTVSKALAISMQVSYAGVHFFKAAQNPTVPDLYESDMSHPSYAGSCLAALTHYHTVFGEFPADTASLSLDKEVIAIFKAVIEQTI